MIHTIGRVARTIRLSGRTLSNPHRRCFSVKAIYSTFPATLHHYSPRPGSRLLDHKELDSRPDDLFDEGVVVDQNGLVYPGVSGKLSQGNGAVMQPNTFLMQILTRHYYDEVLDRRDQGKSVEAPFVFTIPKGTPIPSHLILINEFGAKFSLQPSCAMSLQDLNRSLDEFYDQYAAKETADSWLDKHPYEDAMDESVDEAWMGK